MKIVHDLISARKRDQTNLHNFNNCFVQLLISAIHIFSDFFLHICSVSWPSSLKYAILKKPLYRSWEVHNHMYTLPFSDRSVDAECISAYEYIQVIVYILVHSTPKGIYLARNSYFPTLSPRILPCPYNNSSSVTMTNHERFITCFWDIYFPK